MAFLAPAYIEASKNATLPIIHDLDSQLIQGGIGGQHYHLTLSEIENARILGTLIDKIIASTQYTYEPVMLASGDIVTISTGDIVISRIAINSNQIFQPGILQKFGVLDNEANAVTPIGSNRVVILRSNGASHADSSNAENFGKIAGVSVGAANTNATVTYRSFGLMTEVSWSWTPGADIFAGPDGLLVENAPVIGFVQKVGHAPSSTSLFINLGEPILL